MKSVHRRLAAAAAMLLSLPSFAVRDAEALDRAVRNLDSAAQEALLLFAASATGDAPANYVRVQREEIGKLVAKAAKPLGEAGPSGLEPRAAKARALSDALAAALANADERAAQAAARGLRNLARGEK
jgi:hypothetical protein